MLEFEDKILLHIPKCGGTSVLTAFNLDVWNGDTDYNENYKVRILYNDIHQTHIPYSELKTNKQTYAFVRNPWARTVSRYFYCKKRYKITESFEDFVKNKIVKVDYDYGPPSWRQQIDWLGSSTICMKVEDGIQNQIKLYLGIDINIPTVNSMHISDYKSLYNETTYNLVKEYYKDDIEKFDYN